MVFHVKFAIASYFPLTREVVAKSEAYESPTTTNNSSVGGSRQQGRLTIDSARNHAMAEALRCRYTRDNPASDQRRTRE